MIDNSEQVLNTLGKINYFSSAKCNDSYDFSTLYTSISHDSLKYAMKCLIQEAYKVRDNNFLVVRGTDCAPLLANIFLFFYEYRYMKGLIKSNIAKARRFNNTLRDVLILNNTSFVDTTKSHWTSTQKDHTTTLSYLDILIFSSSPT